MRSFTHIILIVSLAATAIYAGTSGKISGQLTDSKTGEPLVGCNILLVGTTMGGISDDNGRYFILNIPPEAYTVEYRMMGYKTTRNQKVVVNIDRTIIQNIEMESTVLEGEEVTVYAAQEEVRLDVSFSQIAISSEQIVSAPTGLDFRETIAMGVGVSRNDHGLLMIRGSEVDGIGVYVDNFNSNDVRTGNPDLSISKEAIQEIQIIRGGFSAEYGQARSGMINIVKKEGAKDRYTGSFELRESPPSKKHFGPDIYSPDNWWDVGRFLSMEPTEDRNGDGSPDFEGWTSWYNSHKSAAKGSNDTLTYEIWKWRHRPRTYANKPDYYVEGTLGGPVPFTKGKVTFFLDGCSENTQYPLPFDRPAFYNNTLNLKLRFSLGPMTKLYLRGGYNGIHSVTYYSSYERRLTSDYYALTDAHINPHYWENVGSTFKVLNRWKHLYDSDGRLADTNILRYDLGLEFAQTVNQNSYYSIRLQYSQKKYMLGHGTWRDPDTLGWIGDWPMTEEPEGYVPDKYKDQLGLHCLGAGNGERDSTRYETYFINADYTNQISSVHELKVGAGLTIENMRLKYGTDRLKEFSKVRYESWMDRKLNFQEGYVFMQDKVEFKGMIMDIGLRADILHHNEPVFLDPYSFYYTRSVNFDSLYQAPHEVNDNVQIVLAPRLGVSYPIGPFSKLFFNYGYFYQRPRIEHYFLYEQSKTLQLRTMSNPELDYRKVISYEIGFEQSMAGKLLYTLTGYYKDVSNNVGTVNYTGTNGSNYNRAENNSYSDIKGFEIETRFSSGILRAMINYDYRISSSGQYGWKRIFADPQATDQLKSANQRFNKARPEISAYAGIITPAAKSQSLRNILFSRISMTLYFRWKAGRWLTYHGSDYYPGNEVNNIQWKPEYNFDLRIEKDIAVGGIRVAAYTEIRNLLNDKFLTSDRNYYFDKDSNHRNAYLDLIGELNLEPGEYNHPEIEKILMPLGYYSLYGFPRDIQIGMKFRF